MRFAFQFAVLALLLLAFLVTAGPGMGGGGFGGGGFGGGHFGTSGGRSGLPRPGDAALVSYLFAAFLLVVAGLAFMGLWQLLDSRYRVVEIVVVVREGSRYTATLDALFSRNLLLTSFGRARVLSVLRKNFRPADLLSGFVRVHGSPSRNYNELNHQAAALYHQRLTQADLREYPNGDITHLRRRSGVLPQRSDACLIGIIAGVGALTPAYAGGKLAASDLLRRVGTSPVYQHPFLYIYYAPEPGRRLSEGDARCLRPRLLAAD